MHAPTAFRKERQKHERENQANLAFLKLDETVATEQAAYGKQGGKYTRALPHFEAYIEAREQTGKHRDGVKALRESFKDRYPYESRDSESFPGFTPGEYGQMVAEVTEEMARPAAAMWNGQSIAITGPENTGRQTLKL